MVFGWLFGKKGTGLCPACKEKMALENYEGVKIDRCNSCQGTWCDKGELQQIIETKEKTFDSKMIVKLKVLKDWKVSAGEANSDRPCPRCGKMMRTVNYKDVPGLLIEKCQKNCGVWLDKNELEKVQALEENA